MHIAWHDMKGKFKGVKKGDMCIPKNIKNRDWNEFLDWDGQQPTPLDQSDITPQAHVNTADETEIKRVDDLTSPTQTDLNSIVSILCKERRNQIPE